MSEMPTERLISMVDAAKLETILLSKCIGTPYPPCPICRKQPHGVIRGDQGPFKLFVEHATR